MKVNQGFDVEVIGILGDTSAPPAPGTTTGTTATTATDSGAAWTTNQWKFHLVQVGNRYGVVQSNTATTLTVDQWYDPANPQSGAASTPGATSPYMILPVGAPCEFEALTTTGGFTPNATDTTLSAEITSAGGGLVRKRTTTAHSAGTNTATETTVFTANGSDTLPAVVTGSACFGSAVANKGPLLCEDAYAGSATLTLPGDQLTSTRTFNL